MSQERPWRSYPQKLDADEDEIGDPLGPPILWPDGRHVAANGLGRIFLWEPASGECTRVLATEAICRDADPAFTLTAEPELGRVLDGHRIREFACFDSALWKRIAVYAGHTEEVRAATFVSGDRIVSISGDSTARLWDAWSGECLRTLDTHPLYALADDPSRGRLIVAGSRGSVWVLDRLQLQVIATFQLPQAKAQHLPLSEARKKKIGIVWNRPSAHIRALAWHPDGEHLICGSWDFVPKLLDLRTGRVEQEWHGHEHWVDAVAVEPTRRRLVTGSSDGTIRVWSLDSNQCLGVYELGGDTVGGLLLHGSSIYATRRGELLEIPWPD
jgi:WD40 repeat protein